MQGAPTTGFSGPTLYARLPRSKGRADVFSDPSSNLHSYFRGAGQMDFSTFLVNVFSSPMVDEFLVWGVALAAGVVALIALANALEMLMDAEAG